MRIAAVLAGFTMGQSDVLRKAMGKKDPKVMAKQREAFMDGARAKGVNEKKATKIFDLMEYFAGYGFNKSHSTTYAWVAYQTAYLKANYPWHFMAALLTIEAANTDKLAMYLGECRDLGVPILPPDINRSELAVHGRARRASASACARSRTSAKARSCRSSAARKELGRDRFAVHAVRARRPAAGQQARAREPGQGRGARLARAGGGDRRAARARPAVRRGGQGARAWRPAPARPRQGAAPAVRRRRRGRRADVGAAARRRRRGPRRSSSPARRRRSAST